MLYRRMTILGELPGQQDWDLQIENPRLAIRDVVT